MAHDVVQFKKKKKIKFVFFLLCSPPTLQVPEILYAETLMNLSHPLIWFGDPPVSRISSDFHPDATVAVSM